MPVKLGWNVYGKSVQPYFHINWSMTPFSLIIPILTLHDRLAVVVFHSLKRPTWTGRHIRLVAEVPQLHRCRYWPWSRWTYDLVSYCSGISAEWKISVTWVLSVHSLWYPFFLSVKILIPRYDDPAVQSGSEVEFETKFATSSQPPRMKHFAILSNSLWSKYHTWAFSYSLRDSFLCVDINNSNILFRFLSFRSP